MKRAAGPIAVGALLALGGCRSEPSGPKPLEVPVSGLKCELLLPSELREQLLPGARLTQDSPCPTCGPVCTLRVSGPPETLASVAYDCEPRTETDYLKLLEPTLRAGGEEVPVLGRAAARASPAPGVLQVVTFDDDTPCSLVTTWLGASPERALELARAALHAATPDSVRGIAPPPPLLFLQDDAGTPDGGDSGSADAGAEPSPDAGAPPLPAALPDAGALRPRPRPRPPTALDGGTGEAQGGAALPAPGTPAAPRAVDGAAAPPANGAPAAAPQVAPDAGGTAAAAPRPAPPGASSSPAGSADAGA
ncbi:hypothetical protein FGE12_14545 [Aggregicoccus sp. 17bor-14]|uniref:hypothetical protein n=1 Tax=Myxococcaceae TaxID=31 RepID=UPI00129C2B02|nr:MULTISPECIES: hypothetical protein [Myxococcaceae]MBF5043613.1 hypothetical protein [Simulacricoccus sp. 17bor-14]MRI89372.1 hypothetical protein [Aggregicoccus sp. 17bor-14]